MSLALEIALAMFILSMLAVGGAIAIVPELYRLAVDTRGWLGAAEFNELFAISQAAPGPSVMIVALVGWKAAGPLAGALAMAAFIVPSSVIAVIAFRKLRHAVSPAKARAVQMALAPISCALIAASGSLIAVNLAGGIWAWAIVAAAWAVAAGTALHPLWILLAGAAAGAIAL